VGWGGGCAKNVSRPGDGAAARAKVAFSGSGQLGSRSDPAQLKHAMPDVSVFRQMGGSISFTARGYHLVEGAALGKLGVEFAAEFTRPAGGCVEAIDDGWVDVVHEKLLEAAERICQNCEAETHFSASDNSSLLVAAFVQHGKAFVQARLWKTRVRAASCGQPLHVQYRVVPRVVGRNNGSRQ
jgi:hypothetical protein